MKRTGGSSNPRRVADFWYPMVMKDAYGENYEEMVQRNIDSMNKTYTFVIPDIHGRLDLLLAALETIHETADGGKIVFLGDYVDRGPQSMQVIERLMHGPSDGWEWVFLQGNHEDMMLKCWDNTSSDGQWWRTHGGDATMQSYGNGLIPRTHLNWLTELEQLHEDEHRVYVHAAVSETVSLGEQTEAMLKWYKYPEGADIGWNNHHVVHGHVASTGPELLTNRTNLDTGAWIRGAIYIGMFDDDLPGGPIRHGYVRLTDRIIDKSTKF